MKKEELEELLQIRTAQLQILKSKIKRLQDTLDKKNKTLKHYGIQYVKK